MTNRRANPSFHELKAVTHLVHECCDLGADPIAWREHLLRGLRQILDADVLVIHSALNMAPFVEDEPPKLLSFVQSGMDGAISNAFQTYTEIEDPRNCAFESAVDKMTPVGDIITIRREDVLADKDWERSTLRDVCYRQVGLDGLLASRFSAAPDAPTHSIVLNRANGRRPFDERERQMLAFCFAQVMALQGNRLTDFGAPGILEQLPPRERDVLYLFLSQQSERNVSTALRISPHTVRDYAKRLNKKFVARSRDQLLANTLKFLPILKKDFQVRHGWTV